MSLVGFYIGLAWKLFHKTDENNTDQGEVKLEQGDNEQNLEENKNYLEKLDQILLDNKVLRDSLYRILKQQNNYREGELKKAKELVRKGQKERAKIVLRTKKAREYFIKNIQERIETINNCIKDINDYKTKQEEINITDLNIKIEESIKIKEKIPEIENENEENFDEISSLFNEIINSTPEMKNYIENEIEKEYNELNTEN